MNKLDALPYKKFAKICRKYVIKKEDSLYVDIFYLGH